MPRGVWRRPGWSPDMSTQRRLLKKERKRLIMDNITITYVPGDNPYARKFTCNWEIPSDANICEIHSVCRDFCKLLGYAEETINEYFGERVFEDD